MREKLIKYCLELTDGIPHDVYVMLLIIFCAGAAMLIGLRGWKRGLRYSMGLLLIEYVFLLYGSTVVFRDTMRQLKYNFTPFWSYVEIANGDKTGLLSENIMNIVVFVPVGVLFGVSTSQWRKIEGSRLKGWTAAFFVGLCLSIGIEALQFVLIKGFSEVDDVMHNTMGCLIGYGIYKLIKDSTI